MWNHALQKDAMQIRQAGSNDLGAVLSLYKHLHEDDTPADDSEIQAAWDNLMHDPRSHLFILEVDGEAVSTCVLCIIPNLTRKARPFGIIENVVTRKEFRKKGYASALLSFTLGYAWEQDCYKVMLSTSRREDEVFRLYEKVGFLRGRKKGLVAYPPQP